MTSLSHAEQAQWNSALRGLDPDYRRLLLTFALKPVRQHETMYIDHDCEGNDGVAQNNRERFVQHIARLQAKVDALVGELSRLQALSLDNKSSHVVGAGQAA